MRLLKRSEVDLFEKLTGQLTSTHQEISSLAKKSPNDAVNEFKLKLVNALMVQCNSFFGREYVPFDDFTVFSVEQLPTNSDVSFVAAQYLECAEKFRADHIKQSGGRWYWQLAPEAKQQDGIPTSAPRKLVNQ